MRIHLRGEAAELLGLLHMEIDEVFCAVVFSFAPLSLLLLLLLLMMMTRMLQLLQIVGFLRLLLYLVN